MWNVPRLLPDWTPEGARGGGRPRGGLLATLLASFPGAGRPAALVAAAVAVPVLAGCATAPGAADGPASSPVSAAGAPGSWAERTLRGLTLREKVGQMLMPIVLGDYAPEGSPSHERAARLVEELHVGGVIVSVGTPADVALKLNDLQRHARVPLLVAADLETGPGFRMRGAVHSPSNVALGGATEFPALMALGAADSPELAYQMGRVTALEARALGIHVPFAPVLDVNSNPDNPIINVRSFGEDPGRVAELGVAFVRGVEEHGAIATGKHFPGHGDTETDSHLELPLIRSPRARLEAVELVPFRRAVDAGMGGVMTAHVAVPALSGADGTPATLSARVMTDLLRREMGFDGLLFTDAMDMAAVDREFPRGEATVRAVEAGADVILMPPDVAAAANAVVDAVASGRLSEARIDASVRRILVAKERLGLAGQTQVSMDGLLGVVGVPQHLAVAEEVARRSLTLLRDEGGLLPLRLSEGAEVLSVSYRRPNDLLAGRWFDARLRSAYPRLASASVGRDTGPAEWDDLFARAGAADLVVVSLYVTAVSYAGSVALSETAAGFVRQLARRGIPHVVVSFGSPYLLREVPEARAYLLAWSGAEVSQRAAAGGLLGESEVTGRTPTAIPPFFRIGDGIRLPAAGSVGGASPAPAAGAPAASADPHRFFRGHPTTASFLEADPLSTGMSPEALARVDSLLLAAVEAGVTPGAALAVGRSGGLVRLRGYGWLDHDRARLVSPATLYDLASLTKVVGTTTAVMLLEHEGSLSLDDPVVRHLPGWDRGDPRKARVTVRDLLLHRGGLEAFRTWFRDRSGREGYRESLFDEPLVYEPGARTVYSDLGAITLGLVVEAVAGTALDVFLRERLFAPLGMDDTRFVPDASLLPRIAPTEVDTTWRGVHIHGVVHDENADAMGGVAGHAGLFSTAFDLAVFADLMLRRGAAPACEPRVEGGLPCPGTRSDVLRLLSPDRVAEYGRRQADASSRALGWDTPEGRSSAGDYLSAASFGHTGFTGTSIWIDPELDLYVVLLTNRVNPTRANDGHIALRRAVHDAVALSVTDRPVRRR